MNLKKQYFRPTIQMGTITNSILSASGASDGSNSLPNGGSNLNGGPNAAESKGNYVF